ncbi:MAG: hypothetical protein GF375_04825, partial [Candidatus Omnitrophica bacterium]|nr:hypothetical protein [Candidatus Omnitrophota bacterium]MBD3269351.1 hypothetical protein [Candidatus Omnitrophota bacterium]
MAKKKVLDKIAKKIKNSKTFMVTAHVNLEGDALGSELATYILLRKLNKKVAVCNHDRLPHIYEFFPFSRIIKNNVPASKFDVAMVLDCSDSSRAGKIKDSLSGAGCIINIDHHVSNTFFGDINWVEPAASSASQMVYYLCRKLDIMDKNIATCLYTGIFTDTGSFTYASTNSETHRIISHLLKYKVFPHRIYEKLHSVGTPADLNFIGRVMSNLHLDSRKKICWAKMPRWVDKGYDITEIIFSIMRLLKGVEVFVLFKRVASNKIRVNFRSRSKVDVNIIARFFGGGGHK